MKKQILLTILSFLASILLIAQNLQGDYSKKHFFEEADFSHIHFHSEVTFEQAVFSSTVNFQGTKFDSLADFRLIHFSNHANFIYTEFFKGAFFASDGFVSNVTFMGSKFHSTAFFAGARFYANADFSGIEFNSLANFSFVRFDSIANFQATKFNSEAQFWVTQFDTIANFSHAVFKSNANFRRVQLPHILDFNNVHVNEGVINLIGAEIDSIYGECRINLIDADIEKIKLQYSIFELYFPIETDTEIRSNVYERLLSKQLKDGFNRSAEKLDKEYKEYKYLEGGGYNKYWGMFLNWINKYGWEYGYNKFLIIRNTLYIFLFFTLINTLFFKSLITNLYEIKEIKEVRDSIKSKNKLVLLIKVLPMAAIYTGVIFFGLKFDLNKLKFKKNLSGWSVLKLIYFFTIYILGLVCLGYFANYIINY